MKKRWIKDYCPFAKDQGFMGVTGNVAPGETIFGFTHTMSGTSQAVTFADKTGKAVTEMKDVLYRVIANKVSAGSVVSEARVSSKTRLGFTLNGESGQTYNILVVGNVKY